MAIDRIPFMPFYIRLLAAFFFSHKSFDAVGIESVSSLSVSVAYVVVDWLSKKFNVKPAHTKEFATIALPTNCHGKHRVRRQTNSTVN